MNPVEALTAAAGQWSGTNTLQDPNTGKPEESPSTVTVTPVLGGRFVRARLHLGLPGQAAGGLAARRLRPEVGRGLGPLDRHLAHGPKSPGLRRHGRRRDDHRTGFLPCTSRPRLGLANRHRGRPLADHAHEHRCGRHGGSGGRGRLLAVLTERGHGARNEVPRHAGEGRGLRPPGPARGRDAPARPRPRRQHEHAACHAAVDRRSAGRGRHRDVPLQLPLFGERQGPRRAGRLHGDDPFGGRGGTGGRPRLAPAGGRPFLQRTHDLDGGVRITARGRSRPGLLLLPAPPGGQARDEAGRPPRGRHGADALPERDARRAGGSGPAEAGLREARRAARRSISSTRPTTATRSSRSPAPATRTSSSRWPASLRDWAAKLASRKPA